VPGRRKTTETVTMWGAMTSEVLALRDHLIEQQVSCVVMEATGDYWKPFLRHEALCYRAVWDDSCWPVAAGRGLPRR